MHPTCLGLKGLVVVVVKHMHPYEIWNVLAFIAGIFCESITEIRGVTYVVSNLSN
jgi:hypothetical protein